MSPVSDWAHFLSPMHPAGAAGSMRGIGARAAAEGFAAQGSGDVVLLAPAAGECRRDGWLDSAVRETVAALSPGGFVYAHVPARWRGRVAKGLRNAGLQLSPPVAHLPAWPRVRWILPVESAAVRYVEGQARLPRVARAAAGLMRLRAVRWAIGAIAPNVAFTAKQPATPPLFDWLHRIDPSGPPGCIVMRGSWRGPGHSLLLRRIPGSVAKLGHGAEREAATLARLAPELRGTGVSVPRVVWSGQIGGRPAMLATALEGRPAVTLVEGRPRRARAVHSAVAGWLERWNRATARPHPFPERQLMEAAERLAGSIDGGAEYCDWLYRKCRAIAGADAPLVACHNDLTMFNILIASDGGLAVVDWEAATERGLPLADYFYSAVDAAAAANGYGDRLRALRGCLETERHGSEWLPRLAASTGLSTEMVELCFHGCWVAHAVNAGTGEFLAIAEWLAANRSAWREWKR